MAIYNKHNQQLPIILKQFKYPVLLHSLTILIRFMFNTNGWGNKVSRLLCSNSKRMGKSLLVYKNILWTPIVLNLIIWFSLISIIERFSFIGRVCWKICVSTNGGMNSYCVIGFVYGTPWQLCPSTFEHRLSLSIFETV